MKMRGRSKVDEPKVLRVLFVHEAPKTKTERYVEVPPGREREVMKNVYIDHEMLKSIVDEQQFPPEIIEVTVRVVDPTELRDER